MKKMWMVFAFAGALALLLASSGFALWEDNWRLTGNDNYFSVTSGTNTVAVGPNEVLHVVWHDTRDGDYEIFYKRSSDRGETWSPDVRLSSDDSYSSTSPSVAVSGDLVVVVWMDTRHGFDEIYYNRSLNGGKDWEGENYITTPDNQTSTAASVAVSGQYVHVVWMDARDSGMNYEIYYNRSTNYGASFEGEQRKTTNTGSSWYPSITSLGQNVHVVWQDNYQGNNEIYYLRSTNNGAGGSWGTTVRLTTDAGSSENPSISASGLTVHVAFSDDRNGNPEIYYKRSSTDEGATWPFPEDRRTTNGGIYFQEKSVSSMGPYVHIVYSDRRLGYFQLYSQTSWDQGVHWENEYRVTREVGQSMGPSCAVSEGMLHVVWTDKLSGDYQQEVYNTRRIFLGSLTEPSQGRHLVRDPTRNVLHLVTHNENNEIYYARSTNDGDRWVSYRYLGNGKNPTVGLAVLPEDVWPPYIAVCVAYTPPDGSQLKYQWNDGLADPGSGTWSSPYDISSSSTHGPPSLTTFGGTQVFVAYRDRAAPNRRLACLNYPYDSPPSPPTNPEVIDNDDSAEQPCLSPDAAGLDVHASWKRGTEVWFSDRGTGNWSFKLRGDIDSYLSKQPFVECYADRALVVWADEDADREVYRRWKYLPVNDWAIPQPQNISQSSGLYSESPTQSGRELTTWAEGTAFPGMFDIYYWDEIQQSPTPVLENSTTWSYWPHSQMWYGSGFKLFVNAWTESPNPQQQPPYEVLFGKKFFFFGGDEGIGSGFLPEPGDNGVYYKVVAGLDVPSRYCLKRDGVMKFGDKSVDYARDSLVFELPYLSPIHDYLVKVSSYRETGAKWAQALSVNGKVVRSVQFAPNKVDTAWFKIPPEAYRRDRKVAFSLKNIRGDYVTSLGITLYQRDPKRGGKGGGPQAGVPVASPVREVFAVYPNPMRVQAQIEYSLKAPGLVALSVYDVTGRLVRNVVNERQSAGLYKASWDGKDAKGHLVPGGVYLVRLTGFGLNKTSRVVLVR